LVRYLGLDSVDERAALVGVDTVFHVSETYIQVGDCRPRLALEVNCGT
jgi:hypothetical protein